MTNDDDEELDIDEEDILSIFPEERYNPSALEKMISTIAVLLDECRHEGYFNCFLFVLINFVFSFLFYFLRILLSTGKMTYCEGPESRKRSMGRRDITQNTILEDLLSTMYWNVSLQGKCRSVGICQIF